MRKCKGGACPYMAAWLVHINLYKRQIWWMLSTKMEEASFRVFDKPSEKYQLENPDLYYVHHMSEYEHQLHKKYGLNHSKNLTLILSNAAYNGECKISSKSNRTDFIAFIPFYGGLPPNVTENFIVKSIGQGNSLMDPTTKGLQCLATVCSCLKYFGRVVIGVSSESDKLLMMKMINELDANKSQYIHIIQFALTKPANLPDQIVKFQNEEVFNTLVIATNISTLFAGRRKTKSITSDPKEYMKRSAGIIESWMVFPLLKVKDWDLDLDKGNGGERKESSMHRNDWPSDLRDACWTVLLCYYCYIDGAVRLQLFKFNQIFCPYSSGCLSERLRRWTRNPLGHARA
eukprot:gene9745-20268_t